MAYSTTIGCDLCDAVGLQNDPNFHLVEGLIDKYSDASISIDALVCTRCLEPFMTFCRELREKDKRALNELLDSRVQKALTR